MGKVTSRSLKRTLIRTQVLKWFTLVLYLHYRRWTIVHDINLDSKFAINYLESNDIDDLYKSRLTFQILMRWNIQNASPPTQKQNTKPFAKRMDNRSIFNSTLCTWYIWALWNINAFWSKEKHSKTSQETKTGSDGTMYIVHTEQNWFTTVIFESWIKIFGYWSKLKSMTK